MKQSTFRDQLSTDDEFVLETRDYFLTGEVFQIRRHKTSGVLYTHPAPAENDLPRYYQTDEYLSHNDQKGGIVAGLYRWVRKYSLGSKTRLLDKFSGQPGRLLDVGCGTGAFLLAARKKGWAVEGVEPAQEAAEVAIRTGLKVYSNLGAFEEKGKQYDAITLWHALEHLPNLKDSIDKIKSLLKPGGVLLVAVPNHRSYDARYFGRYWAAWDVPRHLWHFSKKSLPPLLGPELQLTQLRPMLFDSFYVSMLSKKYQKGSNRFFSAFWIGLRSNINAWRSGEYSSLIYCFIKA